jgi:hypothetical protein
MKKRKTKSKREIAAEEKKRGRGRPEKYTLDWLEEEAELFLEWISKPQNYFLKRFALERGYSPVRFAEFADKSPIFSEAFERVKLWQETKMAEGAMTGLFNPGFTKFIMSRNCKGYEERPRMIVSTQGDPLLVFDGESKDLVHESC